jgi:poly-gamma-glutamate synthesis protein (capsule biosynthesis protein)
MNWLLHSRLPIALFCVALISVAPHKHRDVVATFIPSTGSDVYAQSRRNDSAGSERITIAVVGDLMAHDSQITAGRQSDGTYNFDSFFEHVAPLLSSADLALGNLETVTAGAGAKFTGYPAFNTPDEYVAAAQKAGFDVLTTANNHSFDRGYKGIVRTLDVLDSLGIAHTGTTRSRTERAKPLVLNVKGIRVGIIAYSYGINNNALPRPYSTTVNIIDTSAIGADIDALRQRPPDERPDKILACLHWGSEYKLQPNSAQRALAHWCFARGVDVVLGAHPHVVQTVERKRVERTTPTASADAADGAMTRDSVDCIAVYSMGNFISAQRTLPREAGVIVWLEFEKTKRQAAEGVPLVATRLISAQFTPTYVYRGKPLPSPSKALDNQSDIKQSSAKAIKTAPYTYAVLPVPQALAALQSGALVVPASVQQRLTDVLRDISHQFATPDSLFRLRE